jgi:hypothetical protein
MESSPSQDYPHLCIQVGLTCEACTSETASQLAQVCKGLRGKLIGTLFVQIHPHSACAPMHANFSQAYRAASSSASAELEPALPAPIAVLPERGTPRRAAGREQRRVLIAVA